VGYREALLRYRDVGWALPRQSLARSLAQVARDVGELHRAGRVHGDLKPDNILIAEAGGRAIDGLELKSGEIATVGSPGWASPEQVVVRPVGPQTDVYPLGLMLASLIEAAVFGEMREFIIPTGGETRQKMCLLAEPDIFLDPIKGLQLDDVARRDYRDLLKRCLAFDLE